MIHADSCDNNLSSILTIIIIVASCGTVLLCCLITITTIIRIVFYIKKSRKRTQSAADAITNATAGANTQLSTAYTAVGETFNQPGIQLQKFN